MKSCYTKVIQFFHAPYNRQLFCVNLVPDALQWKFKSGPASFDGGRTWGIVESTTKWLIEREEVTGIVH
jgi:hypothetical protein